jgi:uncharacterized protein (TIGR03437 family)
VQISFAGGNTYTPGQRKQVTVSFANGNAVRYGFQTSARLASNNGQAGDFVNNPVPANLVVICAGSGATKPTGQPCNNNAVQYMQHVRALTTSSVTFEWTAPATDVGEVRFYVAGNAANGNGANTGDRITTATAALTPGSGGSGGTAPTIANGGVVTAFNPRAGVTSGAWIEIYGQNLANTTREWGGADFQGSTAPTALDGVSVTVDGRQASVRFISPVQVNVLAPAGIGTGPVEVVVTNGAQRSAPLSVTARGTLPAMLAPFSIGGRTYIFAQKPNGAFAGPAGGLSGVNLQPAAPGETLVLYGVGFGPARAAGATSDVPFNQIVSVANAITGSLAVRVGETQIPDANILYRGLAPNFLGLYQFNITLPATLPNGDLPVVFTLNGETTGQTMLLTVQR